jgi:hypothetical protein
MKLQKGDKLIESLLQFKEAVADWAIENVVCARESDNVSETKRMQRPALLL